MLIDAWEGRHRSLVKAISWRVAGSIDTLLLSFLVTGSLVFASSIAGIETITKVVLYYLHERAWTIVRWGRGSRTRRMRLHLHRIWLRLRSRSIAFAAAIAALLARLRQGWQPHSVAAIGAFLFCFAIVFTPPHAQFGKVGNIRSSAAATQSKIRSAELELATAGLDRGKSRPNEPGDDTRNVSGAAYGSANPGAESTAPPRTNDRALQVTTPDAAEEISTSLLPSDRVTQVQQKLVKLGYLSEPATGRWGPLSRQALKAFKADHDLSPDDVWDEATERSLLRGSAADLEAFVGIWGADAGACSARLNRGGFLPAVIESEGAWAGETFCAFQKKRRTTRGWELVASCSNSRERWTAHVRLALVGEQLIWTSERGAQNYLRCQPGLGVARAF